MPSEILTAESGTFQVLGTGVELFYGTITYLVSGQGVEFFHGQITYEVSGLGVMIYETPLFKFRGLDVELSIRRFVGKPKPRTKEKYELRGGGLTVIPIQRIPNIIEEEEEILAVITLFLEFDKRGLI